ncbi:MAG TPA: protein translocase subunit SecF, partial [Gammaproteobacteria bacterium]|nr:protein translocase subunit SecF [Gammaproteobacteria bacterium]
MQLFDKPLKIDFLGVRRLAMMLSLLLIIVSVGSLVVRGLNFGIDFTGGTIVELGYPQAADLVEVRATLAEAGFGDAVVQHFGTSREVLVRVPPREGLNSAELSSRILNALQEKGGAGEIKMRRVEFVGPQVGEELTNDGGLAMLYALIGILIYVALRFEYRFAVGAVAALIHDVIITLGIFSLLQLDFDLTVLAAILAIIGYSLNDTIVVFDRIRENFIKLRTGTPLEVMNISINQTLARTLMTSFTTLLVVVALFLFGGELIHGFATALLVGILVGTYSSIYVASSAA